MSHERVTFWAFLALATQALGVVFGDIGTSVLYVLTAMLGVDRPFYTHTHIIGAVGLIDWVLIIVVTVFYCGFVLPINLDGNGGITVLYSKATRKSDRWWGRVGIAGVIADGQITPAISMLSAWWGLLTIPTFIAFTTPVQHQAVSSDWLPVATTTALADQQRMEIGKWIAIVLTLISLVVLASIQKKGSSTIGAIFGPVMLAWFAMLTWGGMPQIVSHPDILLAPFRFDCIWSLLTHDLSWWKSSALLGSTVLASLAAFGTGLLAATGGEALYADMGHFGRKPVIAAWALVMIGLLVNYMGQGALLMYDGYNEAPFFALYEHDQYILTFMVGLAVAAAFIASQALFTGCFSLVAQAVRLLLAPRMTIVYTSDDHASHVYLPMVNKFLLFGAISFVLVFRDPDKMTFAYGMAVGTTMSITYMLIQHIYREAGSKWVWLIHICGALILALTAGAYSKLWESPLGLIPLGSMVIFTAAMTIWAKGQQIILDAESRHDETRPFASIINHVSASVVVAPVMRVFLCPGSTDVNGGVPLAYWHYVREEGSVPNTAVFAHIDRLDRAHVPADGVVARVVVHIIGGETSSFDVALHDLPPTTTPLLQLKRWIRRALLIAPRRIQDAMSVEQMLAMFSHEHVDHPEHRITLDESPKVVLVTIYRGWSDHPFLVQVLRHLGIVLYNAQEEPKACEVVSKVVTHRPLILVDEETVWYTRWLVQTYLWIRRHVQTLPEHLGVPISATMYVTLRIDLQGVQGGKPIRALVSDHLRDTLQKLLDRLPVRIKQRLATKQTTVTEIAE